MNDVAIKLAGVSKFYKLYDQPKDRMKEALHLFNKKYHKPFYALKDIDLEVRKGDILGVVGRNGCGKSTLLKLITGVLHPDNGNISVNGKITALLELGAGFNPEFTGIDNIQFYAKVLGISDRKLKEKLHSIIDFAELGDFLYQPVKTYSSGMKSRLGFSVAVHVEPEVLILDEVLAVGDALFKRKCYAKMEEFFKAGKTIIYVSHDSNSVNQLCNRAVLIHEGNIIMDGEPKEVTKSYEKLIFSKIENINHVITEIREKDANTIPGDRKINQVKNSRNEAGKTLSPYFIPGLKPKSTVIYADYDVEISDVKITTLDNKRVNVLVTGEEYIYSYKVHTKQTYTNISFGMKIKNEKGLELAGGSNYLCDYLIDEIRPGGSTLIEWQFTCNLLNGDFYTNAGVTTHKSNDFQFLTRQVDALIFRVITPTNYLPGGIVSLNQSFKCKKENKVVLNIDKYGQKTN